MTNLNGENCDGYIEFITHFSHSLADSMIAEHDERTDKSRPEAIAKKSVVIRDGGYYKDYVNFEYYKLSGGKWFKIKSVIDPVWVECNQPATTWLIEDEIYID